MTRRSGFAFGVLFSFFSLVPLAVANDIATGDREFERKRFAEALKAYDAVLAAKKDGDDRWQALYRAVESEALLFRYADAAGRLAKEKTPDTAPWKARFLLLRAEIAREYLRQYGHASPEDATSHHADVTRRTSAEWHQEIAAHYLALHEMRKDLLAVPIREERYFLDLEKRDLDAAPTLWDFTLQRWTDYLINEKPSVDGSKPKPEDWAADEASDAIDLDDPIGSNVGAIVGALWEEAARKDGPKREIARELWHVRRVTLAFDHASLFAPSADFTKLRLATAERLRRLHESLTTDRGRALAGARAAEFFESAGRFADAAALCRSVEKLPVPSLAKACRDRRRSIELPRLDLMSEPTIPAARAPLRFRARNVSEVIIRLYPVTREDLRTLTPGDRAYDLSYLRSLHPVAAEAIVAKRKAIHQSKISAKAKIDHEWVEKSGALPSLPAGLYVAIASNISDFTKKEALRTGILVNITELALFGSAGKSVASPKAVFHVTSVNAVTGRVQKDVAIDAHIRRNWNESQAVSAVTDADGIASFEGNQKQSHQLDALARFDKSVAYWNQGLYFSPRYEPEPVRIEIDLDRPVFRPGQTVRAKFTVLLRNGDDLSVYRKGGALRVDVNDGNGQRFHRTNLKLNDMGSAVLDVAIPKGKLLGQYSFGATITHDGKSYANSRSFSVEEYKRPEFEIALDAPKRPWKYGAKGEVSGQAKYYFGGAVGQAKVTYKVHRQTFVPWFCRWWAWRRPAPRRELARGEVTTEADGTFRFSFPVAPADPDDKDPLPSRFVVEVDARDAGGRTISGSRTYTAGAQGVLLDVDLGAGFLRMAKKTQAKVRALDLNDAPSSAKGKFTLHLLGAPKPPEPLEAVEDGESDGEYEIPGGGRLVSPSLEELYRANDDGEKVASGSYAVPESGGTLAIPPLKPGVYRLKLEGRDQSGGEFRQALVFAVAGDAQTPGALAIPSLTLSEQKQYEVGETAELLLGSAELKGDAFVEVWKNQVLLFREKREGGVRGFRFPVAANHQGGFTVRWFGVFAHKVRGGQVQVDVPWTSKQLKVDIIGSKTFEPRQKASWSVDVRDASGKPVKGEALVRVYDRSLEYYAAAGASWAASLYGGETDPTPALASSFAFRAMPLGLQLEGGETYDENETLSEPGFRMNRGRVSGYGYGGGLGRGLRASRPLERARNQKSMAYALADGMGMEAERSAAPAQESKSRAQKKSSESADDDAPGAADEPRRNFAETAFFGPQIPIRSGKAAVSFLVPDSLTSYAVSALALTSDAKWGTYRGEAVVRKELMTRLQLPRFLREGDDVEIKVLVDNQSVRTQAGTVTLHIERDGRDAGASFGLKTREAKFRVAAGRQAAASWALKAPSGTGALKIRAVGRAGSLSDSEEREIALLPARQRSLVTKVIALDGDAAQKIELDRIPSDAKLESATFQIDPQLALSLLSTIPSLIMTPYDHVEQVLNRYLPLAVLRTVFDRYPALANAVKKIPKRAGRTEAWDLNDPRRLAQISETPWAQTAAGNKSDSPLVDLLDPARVAREEKLALEKLKAAQLPSGGFPWFSGGREDVYMTIYVLNQFGEALRYGVKVPEDMIANAVAFVGRELSKTKRAEPGSVSMLLYGAYTLTSLGKLGNILKETARSWLAYCDEHSEAMTAMGKAYAAASYRALGDKEKAENYLERALEGAREDKLTGVYWAPEKISWLWYNDSVEKHAFLVKLLVDWKPKDPKVPGMVKWLLFNRKGNEWKSTKSSVAAVFSLLDFMKSRGSLEKEEKFEWEWAGEKSARVAAPTDWIAKSWRWTKGPEAEKAPYSVATVKKRGPGLAFASLTSLFSTADPAQSEGGPLEIERRVYERVAKGDGYRLESLSSGDKVKVGAELEIQFVVKTTTELEYLHLKSPRGAGFEAETLASGWNWDQISRFEEPRDSLTNFFLPWVPRGEYVLRYRMRATTPGKYLFGGSTVQSVYAPEIAATTRGLTLEVEHGS